MKPGWWLAKHEQFAEERALLARAGGGQRKAEARDAARRAGRLVPSEHRVGVLVTRRGV